MNLRADFDADAWNGFAEMFAAAHVMVSRADGIVDDGETDLLFRVVQGTYTGAGSDVHAIFDADPKLARAVLADRTAIVNAIAPDDGGGAATRAPDHLMRWVDAAMTGEERAVRTRMLRGLLVEVMYLGLQAAEADGHFDQVEYRTWLDFGRAFGLDDDWLERLRVAVG